MAQGAVFRQESNLPSPIGFASRWEPVCRHERPGSPRQRWKFFMVVSWLVMTGIAAVHLISALHACLEFAGSEANSSAAC